MKIIKNIYSYYKSHSVIINYGVFLSFILLLFVPYAIRPAQLNFIYFAINSIEMLSFKAKHPEAYSGDDFIILLAQVIFFLVYLIFTLIFIIVFIKTKKVSIFVPLFHFIVILITGILDDSFRNLFFTGYLALIFTIIILSFQILGLYVRYKLKHPQEPPAYEDPDVLAKSND